jgi:hypothetical protein
VLEGAGAPATIIPLMHRKGHLRALAVRHLGFLTYANAPILDLITVSEHERVMELLHDHMASRTDWDVASLK